MIRLFTASSGPFRAFAVLALLLACALLAACGQKGPLFIPDLDPDDEIQLEDPP